MRGVPTIGHQLREGAQHRRVLDGDHFALAECLELLAHTLVADDVQMARRGAGGLAHEGLAGLVQPPQRAGDGSAASLRECHDDRVLFRASFEALVRRLHERRERVDADVATVGGVQMLRLQASTKRCPCLVRTRRSEILVASGQPMARQQVREVLAIEPVAAHEAVLVETRTLLGRHGSGGRCRWEPSGRTVKRDSRHPLFPASQPLMSHVPVGAASTLRFCNAGEFPAASCSCTPPAGAASPDTHSCPSSAHRFAATYTSTSRSAVATLPAGRRAASVAAGAAVTCSGRQVRSAPRPLCAQTRRAVGALQSDEKGMLSLRPRQYVGLTVRTSPHYSIRTIRVPVHTPTPTVDERMHLANVRLILNFMSWVCKMLMEEFRTRDVFVKLVQVKNRYQMHLKTTESDGQLWMAFRYAHEKRQPSDADFYWFRPTLDDEEHVPEKYGIEPLYKDLRYEFAEFMSLLEGGGIGVDSSHLDSMLFLDNASLHLAGSLSWAGWPTDETPGLISTEAPSSGQTSFSDESDPSTGNRAYLASGKQLEAPILGLPADDANFHFANKGAPLHIEARPGMSRSLVALRPCLPVLCLEGECFAAIAAIAEGMTEIDGGSMWRGHAPWLVPCEPDATPGGLLAMCKLVHIFWFRKLSGFFSIRFFLGADNEDDYDDHAANIEMLFEPELSIPQVLLQGEVDVPLINKGKHNFAIDGATSEMVGPLIASSLREVFDSPGLTYGLTYAKPLGEERKAIRVFWATPAFRVDAIERWLQSQGSFPGSAAPASSSTSST